MVDTTIRFNDHNSFKVTSILLGYPFGVEQMDYITHSFQAYSTSMLASSTRARTKFLDANGATISDVSHAFAVTTVFGKVEITVAVPATAKQAQLVLLQGGTDWWIAEPKSEQGQVATPYNVNYAGQLTYITPNGIYTGMLTANQIVVAGTTSNPDETLDTKLVVISNGMINLSSTVSDKTTKITNEGVYTGEVEASQITAGYISADRISVKSITGAKLADGTVTATQIANLAVTNGKIANLAVTNGKIANLAVDNAKIANLHGSKITANSITADKIDVTNLTVSKLMGTGSSTDYAQFYTPSAFSSALQFVTNDSDGLKERLNIRASKSGVMIASKNAGYLWLMNGDGSTSLYLGGSVAYLQSGSNFISVDSSGAYKEINGVRTNL